MLDPLFRFALRALLFILRTLGWLVPTVGAGVALMGVMFWVMGIPGSSTPDYYRDWLLGLLVLAGYLSLYGLYVVLGAIGKLSGQTRLLYAVTAGVWVAGIIAVQVMHTLWMRLSAG
ncbi:hypothetical protein [Pelagibacterium lacus]|uniref:Uncharacterized protein n=1 Tax=Pelagibacterium lacus TaxID=2282655 RepID=A0A369W7F0_9HYPH|nr:hypothetical protein [Pelagibacterium lacus]RDE10518.1 hypothetical protein DVH29_00775 [Pelagibacterium lacus]